MSIAEEMLAEFETQAPITRKFLERLPPSHLEWQPHAKSMTAGQLAYHLAGVPGAVCRGAQLEEIPPPNFVHPQPESIEQILKTFEESIATVREVLPTFDDAAMQELWRIVADGK